MDLQRLYKADAGFLVNGTFTIKASVKVAKTDSLAYKNAEVIAMKLACLSFSSMRQLCR